MHIGCEFCEFSQVLVIVLFDILTLTIPAVQQSHSSSLPDSASIQVDQTRASESDPNDGSKERDRDGKLRRQKLRELISTKDLETVDSLIDFFFCF